MYTFKHLTHILNPHRSVDMHSGPPLLRAAHLKSRDDVKKCKRMHVFACRGISFLTSGAVPRYCYYSSTVEHSYTVHGYLLTVESEPQ